MATTQIVFGQMADFRAGNRGVPIPAMRCNGSAVVITMTPNSSNQVAGTVASNPAKLKVASVFARVATDTAIYVAFGTSPSTTSDAGGRFFVPAGSVEYFEVLVGHSVAIKTAP